jgi:hypothetical protein
MVNSRLLATLKATTPEQRARLISSLTNWERRDLARILDNEAGTPWGYWRDNPVGFVEDVLGEEAWSKQREILESVRDNKRTSVPACHAPGKSHIAARAVIWWCTSQPPGETMAITTATTFRQVRAVLWPHIRRTVKSADLPGDVLTTEWKIDGDMVAFGFSAADNDEAAVQGIHVPNLLIIIDEAGGISHTMGQAFESLMTGSHTRLLAIGNPPTDKEDSWFERVCNSPRWNTISIPASSTPNFTGEVVPEAMRKNLVDQEWVDDVTAEFGPDAPFVVARVDARFPHELANKVVPFQWVEMSAENENPVESNDVRVGVDVASSGGDEMAIAVATGWSVKIVHTSSGKGNDNATDVSGKILDYILEAEKQALELGSEKRVSVKIDSIGVGWGVASLLETWGNEGRHNSIIVRVNVGERAQDASRFVNKRAEFWWNLRMLVQPNSAGQQDIRLEVDRKTMAQLSAPTFTTDSSGRVVVEKKSDMRRRGVPSPDRAEAILLAVYEEAEARQVDVVAPAGLDQSNPWQM